MHQYEEREILITVRALPEPSEKYRETSCVAGVDLTNMRPIRLFPVLARTTPIHKYDVIKARVRKATNDSRPESHNIDADTIRTIRRIDTSKAWHHRNELVSCFRVAKSIEDLESMRKGIGHSAPSLALIRPREITDVRIIKKPKEDWTEEERVKLNRRGLFDAEDSRTPLKFVPYSLVYQFRCEDSSCRGHKYQCFDWEASESLRKWPAEYPNNWRDKILEKYRDRMLTGDIQFFVGTFKSSPWVWSIIGIYPAPILKGDQPRNLTLPLDG